MFRFAFLGTSGAIQHAKSDNASLVVSCDQGFFLVDVGGSVLMKFRALGCELTELDGLIITHGHVDHIYGLPSLIHQMWLMGRRDPFHIFGPPQVLDICGSLIEVFQLEEKHGMFELIFKPVGDGVTWGRDGLTICCQDVHHGVPAVSVLFKSDDRPILYYSGDSTFDQVLTELASGCPIVIHEASTLDEARETTRQKGHSTATEAGIFARLCGASQLYMFHFDISYEERLEEFALEAKREFDGQIIIPEPLVWYEYDIM